MFSSNTTQVSSGGYQISRSLRFNSPDSPSLGRTPTTTSNQRTSTLSLWIKRGTLGAEGRIMANDSSGSATIFWVLFNSSDQIQIYTNGTGAGLVTTQVFRDPSAWYHIVVAVDTTQATGTNRIKLYVNGAQITAFTGTQTYYSLNEDIKFNSSSFTSYLGFFNTAAFNGYMTEVNWIDGQQLTPSSFGQTDAQTGVWQPKAYSGSYGTNGFYLNFSDNSNTTAATLGKDYSGNGNNWTPNNFSVTAGAGNDSLVDSPTSYGTDTGVGGTVRGNYSTMNPLDNYNTSSAVAFTFANGNLDVSRSNQSWASSRSTMAMSSGKWYAEMTVTASTAGTLNAMFGIAKPDFTINDFFSGQIGGYGYNAANGQKYNNGGGSAYGATFTTNDVIGVAYDADAGSLVFYKNGTSQGTAFTGLSGTFCFAIGLFPQTSGSITATLNCGQRPFAYTAPSGFKALCTQNLPTPTIGATTATTADKFFGINTWTGNLTARSFTNGGFQPGWVWWKCRDAAYGHVLTDQVRGVTKQLSSNNTDVEQTYSGYVTSFDSSGFSIAGGDQGSNGNGLAYVGWQWKANGSGSTNTSGSITSTVSANTTSGFSVVTYTGLGGAGNSVGHGLGAVPQMIILKQRASATNYNWFVYHQALGNTQYLLLNSNNPASSGVSAWNNTTPTSSVFTLGGYNEVNQSGNTFVAYCFAEVAGYSKFGSYTGNGSADGPFVYFGFRPAYVLLKNTTTAGNSWHILDVARGTYNVQGPELRANESVAESVFTIGDFVSNGFKLRDTNQAWNKSGDVYIFAAFASNPFKFSLAR